MKGIDENGRLFGVMNVIDAVGVLLAVALVVSAGVGFIAIAPIDSGGETSGDEAADAAETETPSVNRTTMVVRLQLFDDARYIVEGIESGPVPGNGNIVAVLGTSRTTPVETGINNTTSNASLRLRINVTEQQNRIEFAGERIYIGKEVTLDLGEVVVRAVVTDFEASQKTSTDERTRT